MKLFDSIQVGRPKRNKFDLSHERKFSLKMGKLVPILMTEVVPGDRFRCSSEIFLRMAPMLAPIMHRVNVFTHYFFVPNRLIWDEWEDFITGGRDGTAAPVIPHFNSFTLGSPAVESLDDYLGLPSSFYGADAMNISALPFRAYQLIYDEYFRDQNLIAALDISKASGAIAPGAEQDKLRVLRTRAWEKDYFTSALPWAQRGGAVGVPITGDVGAGTLKTGDIRKVSDNTLASTGALSSTLGVEKVGGAEDVYHDVDGVGTLTDASVSINELRRSARLQEWLEKNARGGARYIEQILSHFGVKSSDARLQRPEYLGGGKQPVVISEVVSTFESMTDFETTSNPQGNMAGHGVSFGNSNGFKRGFEEHGFVVGIMSILPKTAYQNGIHRMWRREGKFDHYWPEFANIGEQEVKVSEIWADFTSPAGEGDEVFGYQSRYAEYKYIPSSVHGVFREQLAFWHMGRIFTAKPVLNASFVESDPTERIFSVANAPLGSLYCQCFNKIDALRPMPYFGTPHL